MEAGLFCVIILLDYSTIRVFLNKNSEILWKNLQKKSQKSLIVAE